MPPSLGVAMRGAIPDSAFSSSSQSNRRSPASKGRLRRRGTNAAWMPALTDDSPWIKVDLGEVHDVYTVQTQGRFDANMYTTAFSVSSSLDDVTFDYVTEDGEIKIFGGNRNRNAHVTNNFDPPLKARYVRLHPTECGPSNQCALRMDLLGYPECKDNFQRFYTNCYFFVTTLGNFSEQQDACMKLGGNLASITSEEENNFITDLTRDIRSWIGAKLDPNTNTHMWLDGSDFTMSNWRQREPNNWGAKEACVEINYIRPGLWNDHFCKKNKLGVCKRATS